VSGEDRVAFLQGLVSNDVAKATPQRAVWAALLSPQGRFLHDMFVVERDGALLLDVERARAADLKKKLSLYKLRSKVQIEERPDLEVSAVIGDGAADGGGPLAFVDPRLPAMGARLLAPGGTPVVGAAHGSLADYDRVRLALGVPDGSRDIVVDKGLLLENGFDELNGVDWTKGCYMGQELTARTKYRGLVRKRLLPVELDGPVPAFGAIISLDGQEAGELRSSAEGKALALLRLEALAAAQGGAMLVAGDAVVRPSPTPSWMRLPDPS
jgi:folate-binding protein YgfZ